MSELDRKSIGKKIALIRGALGMSQIEFSKLFNYKNSVSISAIETNKALPPNEMLTYLAKNFNVNMNFFYLDNEPVFRSPGCNVVLIKDGAAKTAYIMNALAMSYPDFDVMKQKHYSLNDMPPNPKSNAGRKPKRQPAQTQRPGSRTAKRQ